MQEGEINVTLETLFEILRMEKKRNELQQLSNGFLAEVRTYLEHKEGMTGQGTDSERQLENVHKILEELFNVRERKLLELARSKGPNIEGLTEAEKFFYTSLIETLAKFRETLNSEIRPGAVKEEKPIGAQAEAIPACITGKLKVSFLCPVPRFVGKQLEVYGPFNTGEETELPEEIAELLIQRGRANKIN